jgi:hypothetical protein
MFLNILGFLRDSAYVGHHRSHNRRLPRSQPPGLLPDASLPGLGHPGFSPHLQHLAEQQGKR